MLSLDSLLLFCATLVQVFAIAMQSIQIIKNQPLKAAACAAFVAATNVVVIKMVPQASMDTLLTYVSANALGGATGHVLGAAQGRALKRFLGRRIRCRLNCGV
jgi:uncharacterized protein YcfJ